MLFENLKVDLDSLPRLEEGNFEKLESDYLYYRLTGRSLFFFVIAGALSLISALGSLPWLYWWPGLLGLYLVILLLEFLGFPIKAYAVRERDVSYRKGLLFFSQTSVPLNRVQHCEYSQSPLERLFDLASVKVYTAGGATSDLSIRGLTVERAIRLRDYITKLSSEYE